MPNFPAGSWIHALFNPTHKVAAKPAPYAIFNGTIGFYDDFRPDGELRPNALLLVLSEEKGSPNAICLTHDPGGVETGKNYSPGSSVVVLLRRADILPIHR